MEKKINIAIDGYSSCGKSTLAKALAKNLSYSYIDSGAMYRAVTLFAMRNGATEENSVDESKLISFLPDIQISFIYQNGQNRTILNGEDVEKEIRTLNVSSLVSQVSRVHEVRAQLRDMQQRAAIHGGVVMDGRDIGSAVLPDAHLKIFMTASQEVRVERRYQELLSKGEYITRAQISENISHRDDLDTSRKENPLIRVEDAIELDNSSLSPEEQLDLVMKWVKEILSR